MSDHLNDDPAHNPVRADVSGDFAIKDYSIDPTDQHIADAIISRDPVWDTPGSVTMKGTFHVPEVPPLSALPPHLAGPIKAKLARGSGLANAQTERQLVLAALYDNSLAARVKGGPGPLTDGATHYDQEFFTIARQAAELDQEYLNLSAKLAEIDHVRHDIDPRTGTPAETIVNTVEGDRRRQMEARLAEIERQTKAHEAEAGRRLQKALKQSVEAQKALTERVAEEAEVSRLTEEGVRKQRIAARVAKRVAIRTAEI